MEVFAPFSSKDNLDSLPSVFLCKTVKRGIVESEAPLINNF